MKNIKKLANIIIHIISKNFYLFKLAEKIVYSHNNENNTDFNTNGEKKILFFYLKKAKIIFDVGANIGDWSKVANNINPLAKIYAFEPFKPSFLLLKNKKFLNNNVNYFNFALGGKLEDKNFFTYKDASALNSLYNREIAEYSTSSVEVVRVETLDNFCLENKIPDIDFLKIDVEGGELDVLIGAEQMLKMKKIKNIQFEYGGTYIQAGILLKDVYNYLANKGYGLYKILPNKLLPLAKYDEKLENFQYANYLAKLK